MVAIKLQKFFGISPRISAELLADTAGQTAYNTKLFSGDLIPYREAAPAGSTGRTGAVRTLYGMVDPVTAAHVWLSWATDVDIITMSAADDNEQRIYYTGDGGPKVTHYALATGGAGPFPSAAFDLGLPLPTTVPATSASAAATAASASYARDSGNVATLVTGTAHGLRTGNICTIRGFTGSPGDTFNATNVTVTVVDSTTITYFSPGATVTTTTDTTGTVDLAGNTITRTYVYTWITPWGEESIASEPSTDLYIKEGQTVAVSSLPSAPPSGDNYIRGIRLYRTLTSVSGTEYYRLSTCWFPRTTATVSRLANVASVKLDDKHNAAVGDFFKLSGCTDATFDIASGTITAVPDLYTLSYAQTDIDVTVKADTTGTYLMNVAELATDPPRFWSGGTFTDDFDYMNLITALTTYSYDQPPANLQGLTVGQNGMVAGFFGNQLCFAEPSMPHAWPLKYRITIERDIVAVAAVDGYLIALTDAYAYTVSGSDPAALSVARIDTPYPCVSKQSVVDMGYGVLFATHGGMAQWSATTGLILATAYVEDWDTWAATLDPTTIVGTFFDGKYFGAHSTGSFIFAADSKTGGSLTTSGFTFTAAWADQHAGLLYVASDNLGNLAVWDKPTEPLRIMSWKSKVLKTPNYVNMGAARVIADYTLSQAEQDLLAAYNSAVAASNAVVWGLAVQLATVNGPTDYISSGVRAPNLGTLNSAPIHTAPAIRMQLTPPASYNITFQLWVDKKLLYTATVSNNAIFRPPAGYMSDTFEVAVSGKARVRSIQLAETPAGLGVV